MKKTIVEYYFDCCGKKVDSEEDLTNIQLKLWDEQCKADKKRFKTSPEPRIYSDYEKSLCNDCYPIYRNAITNFIKELSNYGIEEEKFYTRIQEEEDNLL